MTPSLINHIDAILERSGRVFGFEELGDFVFGGFLRGGREEGLEEVIMAGLELRKHEGLPMAVQIPPGLGFFLIAWACEHITDRRAWNGDRGIGEVEKRMERIERKHKVHGRIDLWSRKKPPKDWLQANEEWERIHNGILIDTLRAHAAAMADLFEQDLPAFDEQRETGRLNMARLAGREDIVEMARERKSV